LGLGSDPPEDPALTQARAMSDESDIMLRFNPDRTFKIVQFNDTQDDQDVDPRTIALIQAVLEDHQPDLVVFNGDNISRGPKTPEDVRTAINTIVAPVDARNIPWFITFGNHDEEHTPDSGVDKEGMLAIYRSYRHNMNKPSPKDVYGAGTMHVLIYGSHERYPVFNIWGLDSGSNAPKEIAGQTIANDLIPQGTGMPGWDWIRPSVIAWYSTTSERLEKTFGKKIPSLMFFHIPLHEFRAMYENGERHGVIGERNEDECPGAFNSGMFATLLERGDVKGVFVGHDHVNTYSGNYFGIALGYAPGVGFDTYGLAGNDKNRLRGARVFLLREDDPNTFETHIVFARDYGIR
jgi:hypothetical protein